MGIAAMGMAMAMADTTMAAALARAGVGDFAAGAVALLGELGYRSGRVLPGQSGDAGELFRRLPAAVEGTLSERDFIAEAESVRILFQVTDAEIGAAGEQQAVFRSDGPDSGGSDGGGGIDAGNARSFLFAVVELQGGAYPRSRYAAFTREINKRFQHPTVVLFRTRADGTGPAGSGGAGTGGGRVTLAFVHRRPNRNDPTRDALGNVSLVREIDAANPHRAHLDILADLALPARLEWMDGHGEPRNFDGLLAAWLAALDTEELNRRFYRELFEWFERALDTARFPTGEAVTLEPEEHIIRLITRLLFVWFLKEKGLVAGDLFIEHQAARLLKDYDRDGGDSYYRAILQNLFFATLNTEVDQRRFSTQTRNDHRETSRYRYRDEIADPERLLTQFARTPFVNGGLFDCLDSFEGSGRGGYRVDCFTDNARQRAGYSIPNRLFFGDDGSPGLIDLFERYKFTVEENTPAEQEVALDPELLGKVFENLLAAVNPETSLTARKETGSYYTPRPVVDYMVDEALAGALSERCGADIASIRRLLDYGDAFADADTLSADADALFDAGERERIVRAIAGLKALDPAVGSGAFPMGILHKLTLALRRLDPDNALWEGIQREQAAARAAAAFGTDDQADRDAELNAISDIFERYRDSDYGRKLYLIQNCIYGVDIQPIAVQIAKLRFFIALAIEQEPNDDKTDNYGIRPLPNLETRFVAADTLLPLERPAQMPLGQTDAVKGLEREIAANRERHFHAVRRQDKLKCRSLDQELRGELAQELQGAGFPAASAGQIAAWDPFDQNGGAADWFDAGYMFGVNGGFDVVIGNPPYIQLQKGGGRLGRRYQNAGFATYARTGDVYQLFYEKGCELLTPGQGLLSYITSNSWLKAEYGKATRRYFAERHTPLRLLEMGKDVFEQAIVDSSILIARSGRSDAPGYAVDVDKAADGGFPPGAGWWSEFRPQGERPWRLLTPLEQSVMDKMETAGTPLKDWDVSIYRGFTTGLNSAFIIDADTRQVLIDADPKSAEIIRPIVRGRDIRRWRAQWAELYLIDTHNGYGKTPAVNIDDYPAVKAYLDGFYPALVKRQDKGRTLYNLRNCTYHEAFTKEKLFWADMAKEGRFAYSDAEMFSNNKGYIMTGQSLKYLCGVLNSRLITWYVQNTAATTGMGLTEWTVVMVERIPVPRAAAARQRGIVRLVERILGAQGLGGGADVREWERELDGLVNGLYGLTGEEAGVVGG